jgi:hypothetical protein
VNAKRATALAIACLSVALTGCAGETAPPASPGPTGASSSGASVSGAPAATTGWLAALRVEPEPDALDEDTKTLTGELGGALVVSPASCLGGLPAEVGASTYVLGVIAPDRATLDELLARTDLEPLFRVEVRVLCTD